MPTRVSGADVLITASDTSTSYIATSDFDVVGGADHVLIAVVEMCLGAAYADPLTVSAEGVPMTLARHRAHSSGASYPYVGIWYLVNPSPGLTTINVNVSIAMRGCIIHCEEWSGVNSAGPIGANNATQSLTAETTRSLTPEASGNFVIAGMAGRSAAVSPPTYTPDADVNEIIDTVTGGGTTTSDIKAWVGYYTTVGTSAVNVGATNTSSVNNHIWVAAEFRATSSVALTATDVSSATVVANPALGQKHALTATGVSSATVVANPALGQKHAVIATGVSSADTVANPMLGQKHALTAIDMSSATSVANPALGQKHALTATGVSSATVVAQPLVGYSIAFTATGVSSATVVAQPAIKQTHTLTAISVSSASSVATPAIAAIDVLTSAGVSSASFAANPALGQKHAIVTPGVTSSSFVDGPALDQKHVLATLGVTSASHVGTPALTSIFNLDALGIKSDIFVATPALHQKHALSGVSIYSDTFVGQPNIPVAGAGLSKVTRKKPYRYIPIQHPDKNLDSLHQVVVQLKLVMEMVQNTLKDSDNG